LKTRGIKPLFLIYFLFFIAFVFLQVILPPWLQVTFGFDSLQTGLLFLYVGVVAALTQGLILPRLSKKQSPATLVLYGLTALSTGLVALGILSNIPLLIVATAPIAFGFGVLSSSLNTLISINTSEEAQGGP
jgi:MFS family permease